MFLGTFLVGACLSAHADPLELKSALVFTGQATELRRDLDPGWLSGVPAKQYTGAAVIDGKWEDLGFRYRLDYDQVRGSEGRSVFNNERSSGQLLQLRKKFLLSDRWALRLGKFNENFDNAHYAHVLDFLKDNITSSDTEDLAARVRGFPIAKLSYNGERLGADLIYSDDSSTNTTYRFNSQNPNFNRGIRQWLGVLRVNFEETDVTTLVQKPSDMRAGFGAAFVHTPNAQMQLYGALFSQRGSRQPVLRNIYPDGAPPLGGDDIYTNSGSYAATRLMEDRWYTRGMLGIGWTSETQLNLRFEWRHDQSGMSPQDYRRWGQIVDFHRSLLRQDRTAAAFNIAWDAQALRARQRDSFLLRIDRPLDNDFSIALGALVGRDRSVLWQPRLRYSPAGKRLDAWIEFQRTAGREGSEFGSALARTQVQVGLRYLFD
ncbi:hypothetical protein [Verminephrobacter aporrectodeae]|uniref:hypothetical protein n=1 Tax=Verminephrobacter aporrectodeae TaxID=1110389 RepID=UPI00223861D3|nr:hypothetical protein [Verminephrobacter aporrectodeae]